MLRREPVYEFIVSTTFLSAEPRCTFEEL